MATKYPQAKQPISTNEAAAHIADSLELPYWRLFVSIFDAALHQRAAIAVETERGARRA